MVMTFFALLGVAPFAANEVVRQAYLKKKKQIDKIADDNKKKQALWQLNKAFGVVINPRLRKEYIAKLGAQRAPMTNERHNEIIAEIADYAHGQYTVFKNNFNDNTLTEEIWTACFDDAFPIFNVEDFLEEREEIELKKLLNSENKLAAGPAIHEWAIFAEIQTDSFKKQFDVSRATQVEITDDAVMAYQPLRWDQGSISFDADRIQPLDNMEMIAKFNARAANHKPRVDRKITTSVGAHLKFLEKILKLNFFIISPENNPDPSFDRKYYKTLSKENKTSKCLTNNRVYRNYVAKLDAIIYHTSNYLLRMVLNNNISKYQSYISRLQLGSAAVVISDRITDQIQEQIRSGKIKSEQIRFDEIQCQLSLLRDCLSIPAEMGKRIQFPILTQSHLEIKESSVSPRSPLTDMLTIGNQTINMNQSVKVWSFRRLWFNSSITLNDYLKDLEKRDLAKATKVEIAIKSAEQTGDINVLKEALSEFRTNYNPFRSWCSCFGVKCNTTGMEILDQLENSPSIAVRQH